tara:strand:- start:626 stop:898 length:273 start_codon:yes stop_codon:yes gene_type:complete
MQQKRFMTNTTVKKMKKLQRLGDQYECPHCHSIVRRLTAAHVGSNASQMIDCIMYENPSADLATLDFLVRQKDNQTKIAICCDACNKAFE